MKTIAYTLALIALLACAATAVGPTVTNVVARQASDGSHKVIITYNLYDPDSSSVNVSLSISNNAGSTYTVTPSHVTGAVGWGVRPGNGKKIVWDCGADLPGVKSTNYRAKIIASDVGGGAYPGQMIYIPAGSFLMGNNGSEPHSMSDELPQHSVTLAAYSIGKYEVTRGEYRTFMSATGRAAPYYWNAVQDWGTGSFTQTDSHPVVGVTYYDAEAFCNWAGGHLPTEAQWERAARWTGSYPNVYPWGNTWNQEYCNNYCDSNAAGGGYAKCQTAPVGSYSSYGSPSGCQDMAGNVMEWCQDWYKSYPGSGNPYPFDYTNSYRVLRGGSWGNDNYFHRCAFRNYGLIPNNYYLYDLGFRLAR